MTHAQPQRTQIDASKEIEEVYCALKDQIRGDLLCPWDASYGASPVST